MAKNVRANIESGVNIVTAIAIVVVAGVVVKRYLFPGEVNRGTLHQQAQVLVGTRIVAPKVDWEQNKERLVFFLQKNCVYCEMGVPFYRRLIEEAAKRNVKSLAILPDSVAEGKQYVQHLELPIENVQTADLSYYKIPATPTVLFVNKEGIIKSVWVGAEPGRDKRMRDELIALFDAKTRIDGSDDRMSSFQNLLTTSSPKSH